MWMWRKMMLIYILCVTHSSALYLIPQAFTGAGRKWRNETNFPSSWHFKGLSTRLYCISTWRSYNDVEVQGQQSMQSIFCAITFYISEMVETSMSIVEKVQRYMKSGVLQQHLLMPHHLVVQWRLAHTATVGHNLMLTIHQDLVLQQRSTNDNSPISWFTIHNNIINFVTFIVIIVVKCLH